MSNTLTGEVKGFLKNKKYCLPLIFTAALAYGQLVIHPTVGIDDTAAERYFQDGLEPYMGRWVLFLLNKVFCIAEFGPFLTELIAVLFLCLGVTLWCVLFRRMLGEQVGILGYTASACIFLSAPVLSEIMTYCLHNGVCIAYCFTALAALFFVEGMRTLDFKQLGPCALFGALAAGCYESMIYVFVLGVIMAWLLLQISGRGEADRGKLWHWMAGGILSIILLLVIRGLVVAVVKWAFRLEYHVAGIGTRGMQEIFQWRGIRNAGELFMQCKRYFLKYYINAVCYLPITLFVLAVLVLLFYSIKEGVRCRKIAIPACAAAILLLPWTMALVEGAASYRAAQYIPLLCGFSALLVARDVKRIQDRGREALSAEVGQRGDRLRCLAGPIAGLLAVICIYNQCAEMNKWFYVDALKYEDARKVMNGIAYELGKNCDVSKPVIFAGLYEAPDSIVQDARLPLDSEKFALVAKLADLLDVHLKEKYYHNGYYQFAEVPLYSVLSWGVISFEGTNREMFRFWEMHGHSFSMETDAEKHREANAYAEEQDMPAWPREGSIQEREEYIIVRLGD